MDCAADNDVDCSGRDSCAVDAEGCDDAESGDRTDDDMPNIGDSDDEEDVPEMPMERLSRHQQNRRRLRLDREQANIRMAEYDRIRLARELAAMQPGKLAAVGSDPPKRWERLCLCRGGRENQRVECQLGCR
jgi:spore coat protein CotH